MPEIVREQLGPAREVVVEHEALRGVAGDRDRALRRIVVGRAHRLDQHLDLERRAILRLVDRDVLVRSSSSPPAPTSPPRLSWTSRSRIGSSSSSNRPAGSSSSRPTGWPSESRIGLPSSSTGACCGFASWRCTHATSALDVRARDVGARETLGERDRIGEQLGPVEHAVVGALLPALDEALERDAHAAARARPPSSPTRDSARQPRHERAVAEPRSTRRARPARCSASSLPIVVGLRSTHVARASRASPGASSRARPDRAARRCTSSARRASSACASCAPSRCTSRPARPATPSAGSTPRRSARAPATARRTACCARLNRRGSWKFRYATRWSATVVLPEPAPPWITTMPLPGCVISSNCSLSISAAISGSALSARATP